MGLFKKHFGSDFIPWRVSGHNLPSNNNHEHFFYIPADSLNRGVIDSFFIYGKGGFDSKTIGTLEKFKTMKSEKGQQWSFILENFGTVQDFSNRSSLFQKSCLWQSVYPYLHPWHKKKNFGIFDQLKKECEKRGLPKLEDIQLVPYLSKNEKRFYPFQFKKIRTKKDLKQADKQGGFWRLKFAKPVQGPLALGFACHFGLGLFSALKEGEIKHKKIKLIKAS